MLGRHYDYENATRQLETLAASRISSGYLAHPLAAYAKEIPRNQFNCTNSHSTSVDTWRITEQGGEESDIPEEVVFSVHGIVVQCDLPPVVKAYTRPSAAKHIQQKVILSGFSSQAFDNAVNGILRVDSHLRLSVRENGTTQYIGQQDTHVTMEIGNRYFTSKKLASSREHIPFSPDIDPKGILDGLKGDFFIHTPENQVEYYERYIVNSEQRFRNVLPAYIKCGDIVEVQLTISLVNQLPGRTSIDGNQYLTKLILRSITLLDQSFTEACSIRTLMI